jgi:Ca2+-binding RTX toxin-like protein
LNIAGADGGAIKLLANLDEYFDQGVDQIVLSDATWTRNDLRLKLLAQASTSGADTITGFNTNDTITGGAGNDSLSGASGNDLYQWSRGDGSDTISEAANTGSADKLILSGVSTADVTLVRSGNDVTLNIAGADGGGIKLLANLDDYFDQGVDQIVLSDATWTRNELRLNLLAQASTSGADTIVGFNTNDTISGGAGNDSLSGAAGNDVLVGGAGADTLDGGAGADTFRFDAVGDSPPGAGDLITAFAQGSDKIDLRGIDANTIVSGDQAFTWIGTAAFSHTAGELRYDTTPAGARTLLGDIDGDGVADLSIQVSGSVGFQAGDFLL